MSQPRENKYAKRKKYLLYKSIVMCPTPFNVRIVATAQLSLTTASTTDSTSDNKYIYTHMVKVTKFYLYAQRS